MAGVAIQNFTRRSVPRFAYTAIVAEVLPGWEVSLAFVGAAKARALNKQLRNKEYTPNVLSYEVGEKSGEIIICPAEAEKQAPDFQLSSNSFLLLLFIHGLLHIKGRVHGDTMEKCERKLLAKFAKGTVRANQHVTTNSHRH